MRSFILSLNSRYQLMIFILGTMVAAFCAAIAVHLVFGGVEVASKYGLITSIYTMLGTIYAVLIAFCISGVWQNFSASISGD